MGRLGTLNPRHLLHLWGIFDLNICRGYMCLYHCLPIHFVRSVANSSEIWNFTIRSGQFQPQNIWAKWVRVVWVNLKNWSAIHIADHRGIDGYGSELGYQWTHLNHSTKQAIHGEVDGFDLFDPQIDDAQHDQSHVLASFDEIF